MLNFFDSETTIGCLKALKHIVKEKVLFKALYVVKASIFGEPKRCNFSQVQRACSELSIEIIFANSSQGKGRIDRAFDTRQDRLIPELRLNKITNMDKANKSLQKKITPAFWKKTLLLPQAIKIQNLYH